MGVVLPEGHPLLSEVIGTLGGSGLSPPRPRYNLPFVSPNLKENSGNKKIEDKTATNIKPTLIKSSFRMPWTLRPWRYRRNPHNRPLSNWTKTYMSYIRHLPLCFLYKYFSFHHQADKTATNMKPTLIKSSFRMPWTLRPWRYRRNPHNRPPSTTERRLTWVTSGICLCAFCTSTSLFIIRQTKQRQTWNQRLSNPPSGCLTQCDRDVTGGTLTTGHLAWLNEDLHELHQAFAFVLSVQVLLFSSSCRQNSDKHETNAYQILLQDALDNATVTLPEEPSQQAT